MARIVEATVSFGRTVQVKQFEPLNFHLSYKIEIQEGDDEQVEIAHARIELEKQVNDYIESVIPTHVPAPLGSNRATASQPATEEQKMFMISWIQKNLPFEKQAEAIKEANGMSKAQAIDKIKSITK